MVKVTHCLKDIKVTNRVPMELKLCSVICWQIGLETVDIWDMLYQTCVFILSLWSNTSSPSRWSIIQYQLLTRCQCEPHVVPAVNQGAAHVWLKEECSRVRALLGCLIGPSSSRMRKHHLRGRESERDRWLGKSLTKSYATPIDPGDVNIQQNPLTLPEVCVPLACCPRLGSPVSPPDTANDLGSKWSTMECIHTVGLGSYTLCICSSADTEQELSRPHHHFH